MFKCGICGKEWNTVEERSKCEFECLKAQTVKKEEEKKQKAEAERKELEKIIDQLHEECGAAYKAYASHVNKYHQTYKKYYIPKDKNGNVYKLYDGTIDAVLAQWVREMERMGWM